MSLLKVGLVLLINYYYRKASSEMCTSLATCLSCCVCKSCTGCLGASLKQQVRLSYLIFDGIFVALALVILYGISHVLVSSNVIVKFLREYGQCPEDQDMQCFGISAVYRISLALVVLHVFVLLWLLFRNGCSKRFNEGVWLLKILIVVASFVLFFFVKNSVFETYSKVIMVLSLVFLFFQIIMIIDLSYKWGAHWVKKYDAGKKGYMYPLIGSALILYAATGYGIARSYKWFWGCGVGTLGVSLTLGLIVLATLLVFFKTHPSGSLLTTGVVAAYSTFLTWSGLSNMPETCNPLVDKESTTIAQIVFGLLVIIIALVYTSIGKAKSSNEPSEGGISIAQGALANDEGAEAAYRDEENGAINAKKVEKDGDLKNYKDNNFIYFHIIMIFASFYVAMILTNWGQPAIKGQTFIEFKSSKLSMWIKLGAAWTTLGLYNWTLVAPKIFRNRQFA